MVTDNVKNKQEKVQKHFIVDIDTKTIDKDNRTCNVVISSEVVDRDGDILKVAGISLRNYKKNPVILWCHNSYEPSIGKALEITKTDTQLLAVAQFAETPEALKIWELVKDGYIKCVSIGFSIVEQRFANKRDKDVYGEKTNRVINKSEMYEFSFVNIPANTDSIITAIHKGIISKEIGQKYFDIDIDTKILKEEIKEVIKKEIKEEPKEAKKYEVVINRKSTYTKNIYKIEFLKKKGQITYK